MFTQNGSINVETTTCRDYEKEDTIYTTVGFFRTVYIF